MRDSASAPSNWSPRPSAPRLTGSDVHVWRAFLDHERARPEHLETVLAPEELTRASRYAALRDRHHFISSRGILRSILGQYLGRPAVEIEFTYERAGKPTLLRRDADPPIRFNLSHSWGVAVYAFSLDREVGIDLEKIRPDVRGEELAGRFFDATEAAEIRLLPAERRNEAFFHYWTRKEAYVKARGTGLGTPLDSFVVSPPDGQRDRLIPQDGSCWTLCSLQPTAGYVAAVAAEGTDVSFRLWDWSVGEGPDGGIDS